MSLLDEAFDDKEQEGFEELERITNKSVVAKCFCNGVYNYRSSPDGNNGKQYCCLSDEGCMYYKSGDLCTAYNNGGK